MSQLGLDGIGLKFLRLGHFIIAATIDTWLLASGRWNDDGQWVDNAKWKD